MKCAILLLAIAALACAATVRSPNGSVAVEFSVAGGCAGYAVSYRGRP